MGNTGLTVKLIILLFLAIYVALISLAATKLIKSGIEDGSKVYWTVAIVIFNLLAAIPFILYHDYFLSPDKRADR